MNQTETGMLLAKIATYDNRSITPEIIRSWHEALDPRITMQDARKAVADFYGDPKWTEKRQWIMPADLNFRCMKLMETARIHTEIRAQLPPAPHRHHAYCEHVYREMTRIYGAHCHDREPGHWGEPDPWYETEAQKLADRMNAKETRQPKEES